MLIITTPSVEGKQIAEYYGIVSGEAILGWVGALPPTKKNCATPKTLPLAK
jgi:hypothetical protein